MLAAMTRPPLFMARNTNPSLMSAAAIQESMALLVQLGIGTVRTRPPLPIRSTITHRASTFTTEAATFFRKIKLLYSIE